MTNTQIPNQVPVQPNPQLDSSFTGSLRTFWQKLKPVTVLLWNKFYSNKKVFWPVVIAFGLIFLVMLIGLIFGRKNYPAVQSKQTPSPSPIIQNTPQASASGDILSTSGLKLTDLKNQINNLDVNESNLQPPSVNFDIRFTLP